MIIFDIIYHILELIILDDEARKFKYKYNSYEEYNRFENPIYRRFKLALNCITFNDCTILFGENRSSVDPDNIERKTFKIEVSKLPKGKAEDYVKALMYKYREKKKYDPKTGVAVNDINMIEDYYFAI